MATATITLSSTTFAATVQASDSIVSFASTSGIVPGVRLYADMELMGVERPHTVSGMWVIRRGLQGTATRRHSSAATVYIGRADQFYEQDPKGAPNPEPYVTPHINILTGDVWSMQGDDIGPMADARTWQKVTTAQTIGALGVRVNTVTTPS